MTTGAVAADHVPAHKRLTVWTLGVLGVAFLAGLLFGYDQGVISKSSGVHAPARACHLAALPGGARNLPQASTHGPCQRPKPATSSSPASGPQEPCA